MRQSEERFSKAFHSSPDAIISSQMSDGLIIEVHSRPEEAKSDGAQSLIPANFTGLMSELREIARVVGREL